MTMKVIHREAFIQADANEKEVRCLKKMVPVLGRTNVNQPGCTDTCSFKKVGSTKEQICYGNLCLTGF